MYARVAQWIEQKFPKLLVGGSIPLPGTSYFSSPGEKKSNQKKSRVTLALRCRARDFFLSGEKKSNQKKSRVTLALRCRAREFFCPESRLVFRSLFSAVLVLENSGKLNH